MSGKLVPGFPAIDDPVTINAGSNSGGAYATPVTATSLGAASGTVLMGSPASGDVVNVTINGHEVSYTVVTGDTTATLLAQHVAAAINADMTDSAIVTAANNSSPTVTITAKANGTVGCYSLAASITGGGGTTAVAGEPALIFGATVIVPNQTFQWNFGNGTIFTYYDGYEYVVDAANATLMRAEGFSF